MQFASLGLSPVLAGAFFYGFFRSWSPLTVTFAVIMSFVSLMLLVMLIVWAMQGRFSTRAPQQLPPPPEGPVTRQFREELAALAGGEAATSQPAEGAAPNEPPAAEGPAAQKAIADDVADKNTTSGADTTKDTGGKPKNGLQKTAATLWRWCKKQLATARATGLLQLIGAIAAVLPTYFALFQLDDTYGRMAFLSPGMLVALALFVLQLWLLSRSRKRQKARGFPAE